MAVLLPLSPFTDGDDNETDSINPALSATALLLAMQAAHAGPQAHVVCSYSHTLGDDAIMMFSMPNEAMLHDFLVTCIRMLTPAVNRCVPEEKTTCDNKADSSAYWAPSLKLPDGTVVKPAYQKTYYQASNVDARPLHPFPAGLSLLAGDHHGTAPNPHITFFMRQWQGLHHQNG